MEMRCDKEISILQRDIMRDHAVSRSCVRDIDRFRPAPRKNFWCFLYNRNVSLTQPLLSHCEERRPLPDRKAVARAGGADHLERELEGR